MEGAPVVAPKAKEMPKPPKAGGEGASLAPATITVSLPADAKLTIDGAATSSTSAVRTFASPALETGKEFHYTLKAEIVVDGKLVTSTKVVTVFAGEETNVAINFPVAAVASK